jgi:hypothetical protein
VRSATDVRRGSLTGDFDLFLANLHEAAGTLQVGLGRTAGPIASRGSGSVLEITFRIKDDAPDGPAIINLLEGLPPTATQLNEGGLVLNPAPSNAAGDALDGRVTVQSAAVPAVLRVVLGDGSKQRSRVTRLTVLFNTVVHFQGNPVDVFRLLGPRGPVRLKVDLSLDESGTQTVARLTFLGRGTRRGALRDGSYILSIDGDQIGDQAGRAVDGDSDGVPGGDAVEAFFRRYGDRGDNGPRDIPIPGIDWEIRKET